MFKKLTQTLAFLFAFSLCKAGDITVTHNETVGSLTLAQKNKVEAIRSLWDWLVVDNGLEGSQSVLKIILKPDHLGSSGSLAHTATSQYTVNSRGKLVLRGDYPIYMSLNMDQGLANWSDTLLAAVVFHEMGHCFGFDRGVWLYNGNTGGTFQYPDHRYTGPEALEVYRAEYDPFATFIPLDDAHFSEVFDSDEVMTPGLSNSQIANVYVSTTMLAIVQENGWKTRGGFTGNLLTTLTPNRRLRDEDPIIIE